MVILIGGDTHTGKTKLAQALLERYKYPYLSLDHLKMGLIRAGICPLTPTSSDAELTEYLWPVAREIVKTAIENRQNLIVEGCYIPFSWREDFESEYLSDIRYTCLIFSEGYIESRFDDIAAHASDIESRIDDDYLNKAHMLEQNRKNLAECRARGLDYILIDGEYTVDYELK